jgi:ribonuclease HI
LSNRSIRLAFDGQIEPFQAIETGIPQGSPISPILFLVYIRDLFQSEAVRFISYIDDISLTFSSTSFRKNSKVLGLVAKDLYRLAENNAIQFDLAKTELIHFQGGKDSLKWPITLPNNELVQPSKLVKWLGVYFDRGLRFNEHVAKRIAQAKQAFFRIERLANSERGLSPIAFRQLYLACVASIADYGSVIWWKKQASFKSQYQTLQNLGLRKILGAFRTSPIVTMEIDSAIPPIVFRLTSTIRQYAFRLAKLAPSHPVNLWATTKLSLIPRTRQARLIQLEQISRSIQGLVDEASLEPISHFKFAPWDKATPYTVKIAKLSKDDQAIAHANTIRLACTKPKSIVVYIDASSSDEAIGIGVGLVSYELGLSQENGLSQRNGLSLENGLSQAKPTILTEKLTNLGQEQLVYNGELEGTTLAIEYLSQIAEKDKHYTVYSDNQAGLLRLKTPSDNPGQNCQLRAITASKLILAKGASISLEWVPGHTDIEGNEKADELAKLASKQASQTSLETSWAMFGLRIKQRTKDEWLTAIRLSDRKRGITRLDKLDSTTKVPRGTKRLLASAFYQLKLGHGYNKAYLSRIGKTEYSECSCGQVETAKHLVFDCTDISEERASLRQALKGLQLTERLVFQTRPGIEQLLGYIASTGIGTRRWYLERVERELEGEEEDTWGDASSEASGVETSLQASRTWSEGGASEASTWA